MLQGTYTACRTNHTQAAAKLHMVFLWGQSGQHIQLASDRKHESKVLKIGDYIKRRLLLFDLGYLSYGLLDRIHQHGGFFVSRLKDNCNPLLVPIHKMMYAR